MHAMTLWQVIRSLTRSLHCPVLQDLALDGERGAPQWLQVVAADFMGCRFLLGFRGRLRGVLERFCTLPVRPFRTVTAPSTCKESASTLSTTGTVAEMQVLDARGTRLAAVVVVAAATEKGGLEAGKAGGTEWDFFGVTTIDIHAGNGPAPGKNAILFGIPSPPWSITPQPQQ